MQWLAQNWFWVLLFFAFIGMHFFGHGGRASGHSRGHGQGGCCGGHGHEKHQQPDEDDKNPNDKPSPPSNHQH